MLKFGIEIFISSEDIRELNSLTKALAKNNLGYIQIAGMRIKRGSIYIYVLEIFILFITLYFQIFITIVQKQRIYKLVLCIAYGQVVNNSAKKNDSFNEFSMTKK